MRRLVFVLLLIGITLGLSTTPAWTGDGKPEGPISISYHGQSFFILTTPKGTKIAFDPHSIMDYGRMDGLEADVACVSHNHNDHTRYQVLNVESKRKLKVLMGLKGPLLKSDWSVVDETIGDARIRNVGVYHDDQEGLQRGKNSIFIVETGGWKIAHLGDLGHLLTPAQLKRIGPVDAIMIPVGGIYTINGSEAKKIVEQLKPKEYIFPMHYGTKVFDAVLPIDEFLDEQDKRKIAVLDENVMTFNKIASRPRPLIVQLHYWPKEAAKKDEKKK